eukprot:TRINITY_DN4523_c1_g1_i3.p1 TRINITY_DN4523_c1_g1~~TRINITY_DN4523_c1_g1_i3.p1  ORF type:complete len:128 (-),score=11.44 TRINITY_DN4523_c1_g1_i3:146-529(-)
MGAFDEGACPQQGQPGHDCDSHCNSGRAMGTSPGSEQVEQGPIDQEQAESPIPPPRKNKKLSVFQGILIVAIYVVAAIFISGTVYSGLSAEQELESWYQVTLVSPSCPYTHTHTLSLSLSLSNALNA